jgi:hypothetical protein
MDNSGQQQFGADRDGEGKRGASRHRRPAPGIFGAPVPIGQLIAGLAAGQLGLQQCAAAALYWVPQFLEAQPPSSFRSSRRRGRAKDDRRQQPLASSGPPPSQLQRPNARGPNASASARMPFDADYIPPRSRPQEQPQSAAASEDPNAVQCAVPGCTIKDFAPEGGRQMMQCAAPGCSVVKHKECAMLKRAPKNWCCSTQCRAQFKATPSAGDAPIPPDAAGPSGSRGAQL